MSKQLHRIAYFLLLVLMSCRGQDYEESIDKASAEIEIANLELQDDCENLARTYRNSLMSLDFHEKLKARETHGDLLKALAVNLHPFENDTPEELLRNLTLFLKSGDTLLREKDWKTLVNYDSYYDELIHTVKVHCHQNDTNCVYVKTGYEGNLENSRNFTVLKKSWSAWQTLMSSNAKKFKTILNLAPLAAFQNGKENVKEYWEMLIDQEGAFSKAEELWKEIKPLYVKLQTYVKKRLSFYYNLTNSETEIPVFLLGSNFGDDWSKISSLLVPHPFIFQKAETYIKEMTIKDIYQEAEGIMKELNVGSFGSKFWTTSVFNSTFCENQIISFCAQEYSQAFTCDKISWSSYLDSFENAIDVTLRKADYLSFARNDLRFSALNEGLKGVGNLIGVQSLHRKIWKPELFNDEDNRMAELFLIALRTLPKLPFYLVADKWRFDLFENGFDNLEEKWWKLRKEYQGVEGVFNNETDFLGDFYLRTNKPYVSKFLGTILQFQIMQYYAPSFNNTLIEDLSRSDFHWLIQKTPSTVWPALLENELETYEISASPLLDFFAPLMSYLESAPLEQVTVTTTTTPKSTTITQKKAKSLINVTNTNESEPKIHTVHEHIEENLEGPNTAMENITMYLGIALLVAVAGVVGFVVVRRMRRKKRSNNRRFQA